MTDATIIWATAIPASVAAFGSVLTAFITSRTQLELAKIHGVVAETGQKMEELEKNTNSMKDALVKVVGESEFAKGKLEGLANPQTELPEIVKRQERKE